MLQFQFQNVQLLKLSVLFLTTTISQSAIPQSFNIKGNFKTTALKTLCGDMKIKIPEEPFQYEVSIYENDFISEFIYGLIYQNIGLDVATDGKLNETCIIQVCGFSSGNSPPQHGECQHFSKPEWHSVQPASGQTKFEISSIGCGCNKNRPNCNADECSTKEIKVPPGDENEKCAVLYQETNCQDCFYNGIKLNNNGFFETRHSTAIKSLYVVPGCIVTQTMYGYLDRNIPDSKTFKYSKSNSSILSNYHKDGDQFHCKCK